MPLPNAHESLGKLLSSSCKRLPDRPSLHLLSFWLVGISLSLPLPSSSIHPRHLFRSLFLASYSPFLSLSFRPLCELRLTLRRPAPPPHHRHPPTLPARNLFGMGILSLRPKVIRRSARWINRACRYIRPSKLFSNNPRRRHLELTYLN